MKFGLHGILARVKFHIVESMRLGSVLVLSLILGCAASAQAEAEADDTAGANSTNYASFQSVVRDQMHANAELPEEAREKPTANNWNSNNLIISLEVAVCLALTSRLFAPRIAKLLDRDLNPVSVAATGPKAQSLKRKRG